MPEAVPSQVQAKEHFPVLPAIRVQMSAMQPNLQHFPSPLPAPGKQARQAEPAPRQPPQLQ